MLTNFECRWGYDFLQYIMIFTIFFVVFQTQMWTHHYKSDNVSWSVPGYRTVWVIACLIDRDPWNWWKEISCRLTPTSKMPSGVLLYYFSITFVLTWWFSKYLVFTKSVLSLVLVKILKILSTCSEEKAMVSMP